MDTLKKTKEYLHQLTEHAKDLDDEEKLHFLIELGKEVPTFNIKEESQKNRVPGCISDAYVICEERNGAIHFKAIAHAVISNGFVSILLHALNGLSKKEILEKVEPLLEQFLKDSKLNANMIPSRMNAFANIFRFMQKKVRELN